MYELPYYKSIHQVKYYEKGCRVSIYIKKSINIKFRPDLGINSTDVELLSIELLCGKERNTLINVLLRPQKQQEEPFKTFLNDTFNKLDKSNKMFHIAGDFNLNVLDHDNYKQVQSFLNLLCQNNMIPTVNNPTRVTRKTAAAIFKCDIRDHFPIGDFCHQWLKTIKMK